MPLRRDTTLRRNSPKVRNQERCPGPMCGELYQPGEVVSVADCTHTMHRVCRVQMQFQFFQTNQDTPCMENGCIEFWGYFSIMERPTPDCHKAANVAINTIITQRIVALANPPPVVAAPPPPPVVQPPPPPIVMQPPPMPMVHPPPHQNQGNGVMVPIGGPNLDMNNNLATLIQQLVASNQRNGQNGNGNNGNAGTVKVINNHLYLS